MKFRLITILLFLFTAPAHAAGFDHGQWNGLVAKNVVMAADDTSSSVNYAQFKEDGAALKSYLSSLSKVSQSEFDSWAKPDQLAFLINAYNAWTVELILTRYPKLSSIKELGTLTQSPWQKAFIPLLGGQRSLDTIEHDMIRGSGRYNDPRIHFGVNCASIGCPPLLNEAFVGERLDTQLDRMTKGFLSDRSRNRIENGKMAVSSIFDWYGGDFAKGWRGANSVGAFFALYAGSLGLTPAQSQALKNGQMEIGFLEYDWRLNDSKGPGAAANSTFISPLWLLRSNPVYGAVAGGLLLLGFGGLVYFIIRWRRKRAAA